MESATQNPDAEERLWCAPHCAVSVAYPPALLDELRLAVLESFYAFPRGGAEMGGVLFGNYAGGVVCVRAWRDVACEHASGPSFALSTNDRVRLEGLLKAEDPALKGLVPVGWFHSHTRSEIFLSEQDLEIHARYFPEPWQVALVLRPSLAGTRAAFFVRESDGTLRGEPAYGIFSLAALSGRALGRPAQPPAEPAPVSGPVTAPGAKAIEPPVPERLTRESAEIAPPSFGIPQTAGRRPLRPWMLAVLLVLCGAAAIYGTRAWWMELWPRSRPWSPRVSVPASRPEAVELTAVESAGQVRIRWNQAAQVVATALGGSLEIKDGGARTIITMHPERLRAGNVNYVRQTDRVEVRLDLEAPDGRHRTEFTTLAGMPQDAAAQPQNGGNRLAGREELQKQLQEARTELINQGLMIKKLEQTIQQMRAAKPVRQARPAEPPRTQEP